VDFLTKKRRWNKGELPKYFIEDDHKPIVNKAVFDEVQDRKRLNSYDNPSLYAFSNKIICGDCYGKFGRKINGSYRSNKKYRQAVWRCNRKYDYSEKCKTTLIHEEAIAYLFNQAVQRILRNQPELLTLCQGVLAKSIRSNKQNATKSDRLSAIDNFLVEFKERSPDRIIFDDTVWRVIIDRAIVTDEKIIELLFINGIRCALPISSRQSRRTTS
jgi:site-specific DNA recombinase